MPKFGCMLVWLVTLQFSTLAQQMPSTSSCPRVPWVLICITRQVAASKNLSVRDIPDFTQHTCHGRWNWVSLSKVPCNVPSTRLFSPPAQRWWWFFAVRFAIFKHEARRKLDNAVNLNGLFHLENPLLIPAVFQAAKKFKKTIMYVIVGKQNSTINCILIF